MSDSPDASRPPASPAGPLQSPDAMKDDEETGLSQSLGQLTLAGQRGSSRSSTGSGSGSSSSRPARPAKPPAAPAPATPATPATPSTPLRPPSRHDSPSRSPSRGPETTTTTTTTTTNTLTTLTATTSSTTSSSSTTTTTSASTTASRAGTPPLLRKASMNSLHSANGAGHPRSLSRRSSHGQMNASPSGAAAAPVVQYSYVPDMSGPPSAAAVAKAYFQAELEAHHAPVSTLKTETVVVVADAVYGHRFSRPRTSKSALASIVERPERIKAGLLGVSLAYVRLGERHADGAFPVHPKRSMESLPSIPFRIHKSSRRLSLSSPAVTNVHGAKWMEDLRRMCDSAESVLAAGGKELQRPRPRADDKTQPAPGSPPKGKKKEEEEDGDEEEEEELHEGDLYLCSESLAAIEGALGAVCDAVDTVFSLGPRRAFVAIRPPGHHCSASLPSGFCWVNNVHVGIMHAALHHDLTHAAIIDFDLHHGDGSQAIAWAQNARAAAAHRNHAAWKKTTVGYFSLHDINSYPCEAGDPAKISNASVCIEGAHGQTVWNVHLRPWQTEHDFWDLYQSRYLVLLDKARAYLRDQAARLRAAKREPRAAIFLSAGFDASEWESPGMQRHRANVPTEFYARLTQDVIQLAAEQGLHVDGRVVSVLEGGYSDRALYSGILGHLSGLVGNQFCETAPAPLSSPPFQDASTNDAPSSPASANLASIYPYDASWWAASELDKLDAVLVEPPEAPPKMLRISSSPAPAYSSPTQSSQAKAVDPLKTRRSFSSLSSATSQPVAAPRPPSPAAPDVSWMLAARELSRLLIPSDRQTDSCTPEDLGAEGTRARRKSLVEAVDAMTISERERSGSRMLLRDRRSRGGGIDPISEEGSVVVPKNRRQPSTGSAEQMMNADLPLRRTSRRLSAATQKPAADGGSLPDPSASRPTTSSGSSRPGSRGTAASANRPPAIATGLANSRKPRASISGRREISPRTPQMPDVSPPGTAKSETTGRDGDGDGDRDHDVSSITNGVGRIRINLITQSQKEARARGAVAEPEPELEPPSSPVLSSSIGVGGGHASSPPTVPALTTTSESGLSTPVLEHYPSPYVEDAPAVAVRPNDDAGDVFVPYQPDGPVPVPVAMAPQEPLKWMPPNVANPAPAAATAASTMKGQGAATTSPTKERRTARASGIPSVGGQPSLRKFSPRQAK